MIDDYRVLWIAGPSGPGQDGSLVLWDTSVPQPRQLVFEMPSDKLVYIPKLFTSSASIQGGIGLHRADPNHRIVGVVCQASFAGVQLDDEYMMIINTADLCAHGLAQRTGERRIRWEKWKSSATIVRINPKITTVSRISGSRFFAIVNGVSYTTYAIILRMYDFSPGARGRRHPKKPPVRTLTVNAGRVLKRIDDATWDFSEDNLLVFNVSIG